MAKRRHYSKSMTIPLAPTAGLIAGMAQPIQYAIAGDYQSALNWVIYNYTGMRQVAGNWTFDLAGLKNGVLPLAAGLLVHKFVGGAPLNANRMLANAGVPFVRI